MITTGWFIVVTHIHQHFIWESRSKESNDLEIGEKLAPFCWHRVCAAPPLKNGEGHQKTTSTKNKKYGVHSAQCHEILHLCLSNFQPSDFFGTGHWHKYDRYRHQATVLWALRTHRWIKQFAQPVPIVLEDSMSSQLPAELVDLPTKAKCHVPSCRPGEGSTKNI